MTAKACERQEQPGTIFPAALGLGSCWLRDFLPANGDSPGHDGRSFDANSGSDRARGDHTGNRADNGAGAGTAPLRVVAGRRAGPRRPAAHTPTPDDE